MNEGVTRRENTNVDHDILSVGELGVGVGNTSHIFCGGVGSGSGGTPDICYMYLKVGTTHFYRLALFNLVLGLTYFI